MTPQLQATLAKLPTKPGVYLLKDARGVVLYVGKAQNLRNRVRQYWQKSRGLQPLRIEYEMDRVADVEYTMTDSVSEALLLEATLIKRHQPRFNVRLKDDKSYPYIKVTLADDFPRIERTRKLPNDGSRYFGPYASASSVDEAMNLIRRLFPFRTCTIDIHEGKRALARPCLLYHIKRCQGPCIEAVSKADYRADIDQVMLFLEGRQEQVARRLRSDMIAASDATDYERAGALRDKIRAIERTMESQKMAAFARADTDVLGYARQGAGQRFSYSQSATARRWRATCSCSRTWATVPTMKRCRPSSSSTTRRPARFRHASCCRSCRPTSMSWSSCSRRAAASASPFRAAARRGPRADGARRAQRIRDPCPRNRALAGRPGQDAGCSRRAGQRSRVARRSAGAHRVLRHLDIQGTNTVGSMVVFEEGRPRSGRIPSLPRPDARRQRRPAGRLRQPPGGAAGGSIGRSKERRAAPRSCAGACPIS